MPEVSSIKQKIKIKVKVPKGSDPAVVAAMAQAAAEQCLEAVPLMPGGCWSRLIAKGLGLAIIVGACISKTPMMLNLWNSQSAAGLSKQSLYGEVVLVANSAAYGMLQGHAFTAYGDKIQAPRFAGGR